MVRRDFSAPKASAVLALFMVAGCVMGCHEEPACSEKSTPLLSSEDRGSLPFALADVLPAFSVQKSVSWARSEQLEYSLAGSETELSLKLTYVDGLLAEVRSNRGDYESDEPYWCTDHLDAGVQVQLRTSDGGVAGAFSALLQAYVVEQAVILRKELAPGELGGSLSLESRGLSFFLMRNAEGKVARLAATSTSEQGSRGRPDVSQAIELLSVEW